MPRAKKKQRVATQLDAETQPSEALSHVKARTTIEHCDHVLYSRTKKAWWKPNAMGYTSNFAHAGRFTREYVDAVTQPPSSSRGYTAGDAGALLAAGKIEIDATVT